MKSYEKMQKKELIDVIRALETRLHHNSKKKMEETALSEEQSGTATKSNSSARKSSAPAKTRARGRIVGVLVPVCAYCKRIRNTSGSWRRPRKSEWLKDKSRLVTHGICPECASEVIKSELEACYPNSPCGG